MKHVTCSLITIVLLMNISATSASAQTSPAVRYMDKINRELNAIMVDSWDYISEVAHGKSATKVELKRKDLVRTSKMAMDKVSKMDAFAGSTEYRDSVVSYLRINYIVLNEDYEKILNMEEISEQSYDKMEAYLLAQELADAKLDSAYERMQEQERIFAGSNKINLLENQDKTAKKLEKAGGIMKYYRQVYLVFFKSYKQEFYLVDAVSRKDFNAMEQNKNALVTTSAEGLETLKNMEPFKTDRSLLFAAKNALGFYQTESSTKIGNIIDFYLQQEKFDKIKSAFDLKPQKSRTKEDVAEYNAAIKEINSHLDSFNKVNTDLNKNRNSVLENWNNAAKNFMDKHIPKYK